MISLFPTGGDDTELLQHAFDVADEQRSAVQLVGDFRVSDTLFIRPQRYDFRSFKLEGIGAGYYGSHIRTRILSSVTDKPVLSIVSARGVDIADIAIHGMNTAPRHKPEPTEYQDDYVSESFTTDHMGICVDPEGTTRGSSLITLRRVHINDTVNAFVVSPNVVSQNADRITLHDCVIDGADIGISYGQSQSRANLVNGGGIDRTRICVTTRVHGRQQGSAPKMRGIQFGQSYQIFDINPQFGAGFHAEDCYSECCKKLGYFGTKASSKQPVLFTGGEYRAASSGCQYETPNPEVWIENAAEVPMKFIGTFLQPSEGQRVVGPMQFDTCSFNPQPHGIDPADITNSYMRV